MSQVPPALTPTSSDDYVVCVGAATQDVIAAVSRHLRNDERLAADDVLTAGGGPAATAAVALTRLGVTTYFIGRVGDDAAGTTIIEELEREGVRALVDRVAGCRSAQSVILVDRERGTRAIAAFPGTLPPPALDAELLELCRGAAWVHVDHAGYPAVAPSADGLRLSVDAGNPIPSLDLGYVDLYAPSEPALRRTFPERDLERAVSAALTAGARIVVVTRGARGCIGADGRLPLIEAPGLEIRPMSTLGAGDVFHGALLAGLTRGLPLPDSLSVANAAAALSCRALDGRSAIPHPGELRAALPGAAVAALLGTVLD